MRLPAALIESALEYVTTCVLGPAVDAGGLEASDVEETRVSTALVRRLGWPEVPAQGAVLRQEEIAIVRRAAMAALGAAADDVQEAAYSSVHGGADLGIDAIGWSGPGLGGVARHTASAPSFERRFQRMIEAAPGMVVICDREGRPELLSLEALAFFGLPAEEISARGWRGVVADEDLDAVAVAYRAALEDQRPWTIEARVRRNGEERETRWIRARGTPRVDRLGRFEGYSYVVTDITSERRIAAQLDEASRRLSTLTESAAIVAWTLDAGGRCTFASEGWASMLGHPTSRALGDGLMSLIHPDDRRRVSGLLSAAMGSRAPVQAELRMFDAAGEVRWVLLNAVPRFEDGRFAGMAGSSVDVTRRRRAEDEQGALLRIASAAARGDGGEAVVDLVAEEVAALIGLDAAVVVRFDGDDAVVVGSTCTRPRERGARIRAADTAVLAHIRATGLPARMDAPWTPRAGDRRGGSVIEGAVASSVAAPIKALGYWWGAILGESHAGAALTEDAEARLERVADLVGSTLAISELHPPQPPRIQADRPADAETAPGVA
jgi:PAS domain S-box-containing protein